MAGEKLPTGNVLLSLDTLHEMFRDPKTNMGATLHYRWILNGRVLREYRTHGQFSGYPFAQDVSWLANEVKASGDDFRDLRLEVTQER